MTADSFMQRAYRGADTLTTRPGVETYPSERDNICDG